MQSTKSIRAVESCNLQSLKQCKDVGENLALVDARGRTLLWKLTRAVNVKTNNKEFNGIYTTTPAKYLPTGRFFKCPGNLISRLFLD